MKVFYLIFMISIGFSITTKDIYDNSWALIIGIDKYESVRKLNYAVKDAESMQKACRIFCLIHLDFHLITSPF